VKGKHRWLAAKINDLTWTITRTFIYEPQESFNRNRVVAKPRDRGTSSAELPGRASHSQTHHGYISCFGRSTRTSQQATKDLSGATITQRITRHRDSTLNPPRRGRLGRTAR